MFFIAIPPAAESTREELGLPAVNVGILKKISTSVKSDNSKWLTLRILMSREYMYRMIPHYFTIDTGFLSTLASYPRIMKRIEFMQSKFLTITGLEMKLNNPQPITTMVSSKAETDELVIKAFEGDLEHLQEKLSEVEKLKTSISETQVVHRSEIKFTRAGKQQSKELVFKHYAFDISNTMAYAHYYDILSKVLNGEIEVPTIERVFASLGLDFNQRERLFETMLSMEVSKVKYELTDIIQFNLSCLGHKASSTEFQLYIKWKYDPSCLKGSELKILSKNTSRFDSYQSIIDEYLSSQISERMEYFGQANEKELIEKLYKISGQDRTTRLTDNDIYGEGVKDGWTREDETNFQLTCLAASFYSRQNAKVTVVNKNPFRDHEQSNSVRRMLKSIEEDKLISKVESTLLDTNAKAVNLEGLLHEFNKYKMSNSSKLSNTFLSLLYEVGKRKGMQNCYYTLDQLYEFNQYFTVVYVEGDKDLVEKTFKEETVVTEYQTVYLKTKMLHIFYDGNAIYNDGPLDNIAVTGWFSKFKLAFVNVPEVRKGKMVPHMPFDMFGLRPTKNSYFISGEVANNTTMFKLFLIGYETTKDWTEKPTFNHSSLSNSTNFKEFCSLLNGSSVYLRIPTTLNLRLSESYASIDQMATLALSGDSNSIADGIFMNLLKKYCIDQDNQLDLDKVKITQTTDEQDDEDLDEMELLERQLQAELDKQMSDDPFGMVTPERIRAFLKSSGNIVKLNAFDDDIPASYAFLDRSISYTKSVNAQAIVLNNAGIYTVAYKDLANSYKEANDVEHKIGRGNLLITVSLSDRHKSKEEQLEDIKTSYGSYIIFNSDLIEGNRISGRGRLTDLYISHKDDKVLNLTMRVANLQIIKSDVSSVRGDLGLISNGRPFSLEVRLDGAIINQKLIERIEYLKVNASLENDVRMLLSNNSESIVILNYEGIDKIGLYLLLRKFTLEEGTFQLQLFDIVRIVNMLNREYPSTESGHSIAKTICFDAINKCDSEIDGIGNAYRYVMQSAITNVGYLVTERGRKVNDGFVNMWTRKLNRESIEQITPFRPLKRKDQTDETSNAVTTMDLNENPIKMNDERAHKKHKASSD